MITDYAVIYDITIFYHLNESVLRLVHLAVIVSAWKPWKTFRTVLKSLKATYTVSLAQEKISQKHGYPSANWVVLGSKGNTVKCTAAIFFLPSRVLFLQVKAQSLIYFYPLKFLLVDETNHKHSGKQLLDVMVIYSFTKRFHLIDRLTFLPKHPN